MSEYTIYFTTVASQVVKVEADSLEDAIDAAYDGLRRDVCGMCAGFDRRGPGIDLGEWEADDKAAREDYPE